MYMQIFIQFNFFPGESNSESESSNSDSESDHSESQETKEEPPVVILSEDEMNKLGAKIMKAELMGNQVNDECS